MIAVLPGTQTTGLLVFENILLRISSYVFVFYLILSNSVCEMIGLLSWLYFLLMHITKYISYENHDKVH